VLYNFVTQKKMNEESRQSDTTRNSDSANSSPMKRAYTTASEVSPSTSVRTSKARKLNDEDMLEDLLDEKDDEDEDHMFVPFPFHGMRKLFRSKFVPNGIDPRGGYVSEEDKQKPVWIMQHCVHCECRKHICHDTRFGLYCGLRVAEMVEEKGVGTLNAEKVSKLLRLAYNEVLRVEIVQQIGVLDTYNDYDPPQCILDKSMSNIMRHFLFEKYSRTIKLCLQDGTKGKYGTGAYGFYSALQNEEPAEREMDEAEGSE
jgi:hypothetical protein